MSMQPYMWPFSLFAPGNLNQSINPGWFDLNVNYAGNPQIEKDVVEKVASFGRQLGIITDALLVVAGDEPDEGEDPLAQLRDIAVKIKALKKEHKNNLLSEARKAMDRLAESSPTSAEYVAQSYLRKP